MDTTVLHSPDFFDVPKKQYIYKLIYATAKTKTQIF
jgi:hypothetical protein